MDLDAAQHLFGVQADLGGIASLHVRLHSQDDPARSHYMPASRVALETAALLDIAFEACSVLLE